MTRCQFAVSYYDQRESKTKPFRCEQEVTENSNLCIFHDKANYENNTSKILDKLKDIINKNAAEKRPLKLVGYNIPDISFRQLKSTNLQNDVYFNFTTFHGVSDFSGVVFSGICDFSDVTFKGGATFLKTKFKDAAYFVSAAFDNVADFSNSKFSEGCRFSYCNFAEQSAAFFTEVIFAKTAEFDNSVFAKIDFSDATFKMEAKFGYAKFTNKVFNCFAASWA